MAASVVLLGAASFVSPPRAALADDTAEDLRQLRAAIQKELADLKKREQKQHNLARTQPIQDRAGGPATPVNLQPGESPAITFGIGFALNDRTALILSY
jgi:hypothetical protein